LVERFRCSFWDDVFCSHQKYDKPVLLDRCLTCSHYLRFLREMDEEDERVMAEIDKIREEHGELE